MFTQNKYLKCYYNIINNAKSRKNNDFYIEKHHIIPKSLGGRDDFDNLVELTAREHFICHLLLPRFTTGEYHHKMVYALWRLCHPKKHNDAYIPSSRQYELVRHKFAQSISLLRGENHPLYGTKRPNRTSSSFTPEWKEKISKSKKGITAWNKGVPRTAEEKQKISETRKLRSLDPSWNIRPPCSKEAAEKSRIANTGKRWVNDGNGNRQYVSNVKFDELIANGWFPGIGKKKVS